MTPLSRRRVLLLPALLIPATAPSAQAAVPPFSEWIGRTALLRSEEGAARLLLSPDGTGVITVHALFACRPLPVLSWRIATDGRSITYRRTAALFASRVVEGSARIAAHGRTVRLTEARDILAQFEGFGPPEAARSCG
jgi:hypothetical protein